jgi:thiamine biosynthesis protein ThiS
MKLQDGSTIQNLLDQLELDFQLVAVEQNLDIIPRAQFGSRTISDGDTLEIVHFVGGG